MVTYVQFQKIRPNFNNNTTALDLIMKIGKVS